MRIVLISDTHNQLSAVDVPAGDVLIHAGDATFSGKTQEVVEFVRHMEMLPHPHKIFVPGNHDWLFEQDIKQCRDLLGQGIRILIDEYVEVAGLKIYGSPWTPRHDDWAFNLDRGEPIREKWRRIPESLDILITHGPPYGILDQDTIDENVGCEALKEELSRIKPKVHVFGHVHHSYGSLTWNEIQFVNASICDEEYKASNKAFLLEFAGKRALIRRE